MNSREKLTSKLQGKRLPAFLVSVPEYLVQYTTTDLNDIHFSGNALNVFPNPFSSKLYCEFSLKNHADIELSLFDVNGKGVALKQVNGTKGLNQIK